MQGETQGFAAPAATIASAPSSGEPAAPATTTGHRGPSFSSSSSSSSAGRRTGGPAGSSDLAEVGDTVSLRIRGEGRVNFVAAIYLLPKGSSTEVLLDAYKAPSTSTKSHYTIFPTGRRGNAGSTVNSQSYIMQDAYASYNPGSAPMNNNQGFLNPEFYMGPEEILRFMWKQNDNSGNYEFFLRGFYLLEDVTA